LNSSNTLKAPDDKKNDSNLKEVVSESTFNKSDKKNIEKKSIIISEQDQNQEKETSYRNPVVNILLAILLFSLCFVFILYFIYISNDNAGTRSKVVIEKNTAVIQQETEPVGDTPSEQGKQLPVHDGTPSFIDSPKPVPTLTGSIITPSMENSSSPEIKKTPDYELDFEI
jgi:hypothetical protein